MSERNEEFNEKAGQPEDTGAEQKERKALRLKRKEDDSWKEEWKHREKGKAISGMKGSFRTKSFRIGSYTAIMCAAALIIAVFVNLVAESLPAKYTKYDVSASQLYSLSEQSEKIAASVKDELTVYLIAQTGNQDETVLELLGRYQSVNSKIKVVQKDPVVNPTFASAYTSDEVSENSLIVVCGERYKYVPYSNIYQTSYSMDSSYQYVQTTDFDGENQITSAIDYVTSDNLATVYSISGHGEASIPSYVQTSISNENISLKELSLISEGEIPEDCTGLILYSPAGDLSSEEKDMLLSYLKDGGRMLIVTDYIEKDMSNLAEVLAYYGVTVEPGMVVEGDTKYCYRYQNFLVPQINSHDITKPLIGYNVLLPYAQGITVSEGLRDGLTVDSLLETSDEAFSKTDMTNDSAEKQEGDIDGPFSLGAAITDTHDGEADEESGSEAKKETKMVVLTTSQSLNESVNQLVSGMNEDLFLNSLEWLCERENSISIRSKSLDAVMLTMDSAQAGLWTILLIGVIPVCVIAGGAVYLYRRKKK